MKDDVQHRKTRKTKRRKGKTRTLKIGGMQGRALREKVAEFMAQATSLLNDGQTLCMLSLKFLNCPNIQP